MRSRVLVCCAAMLAVSACSGGSDDAGEAGVDEADVEASDESAAEGGAPDSAPGAVAVAREGLSAPVEATLSDGSVMVAGIECGLDGAHLLIVGVEGLTPGEMHEAEIEPNAGRPQFFVQDNGDGYSAQQSGYTEASYTLTWPTIDDGLTVTMPGCPE